MVKVKFKICREVKEHWIPNPGAAGSIPARRLIIVVAHSINFCKGNHFFILGF